MKITDLPQLVTYAHELQDRFESDPDKLKRLDSIMHKDLPFWQQRELLRFLDDTYTPIHFDDAQCQKIWDTVICGSLRLKFIHQSRMDPSLVAFTSDEINGERDVQTQTKMGRFLTAHTDLESTTINILANNYKQTQINAGIKVSLTTDPALIYDIYREMATSAATSCMAHPASHWGFKGKFFIPTKDHEVQERIDLFRRKFPIGRVISPVTWYGLSPELALAYYSASDRTVARAIINTKTKSYARMYGNEFLAALLKKEGYQQTEALGAFRSAVLVGHNAKGPESVVFCPYIDGNYTQARLNLDEGLLTCNPEDQDSKTSILGAMRGYDSAGITLGRIYKNASQLTANRCGDCGVFPHRQEHLPYKDAGAQVCMDCFRLLVNDKNNIIGTFVRGDSSSDSPFSLTIAPKEDFVNIPNIRYNCRDELPFVALSSLDSWMLSRFRSFFGEELYEEIIANPCMVHRSSLGILRTDPITKAVTVPWLLRKVILTDRSVVDTLAPFITISGSAYTSLFAKYGTGHMLRDRWTEYDEELRLRSFGTAFYLESDFREVFQSRSKTHLLVPRGEAIYAIRTRNWYSAASLTRGHVEYLSDEEYNPHELTKEHGREILDAHLIVANYLPFDRIVPAELVSYWMEELEANKRGVIAEQLLEGAQA